VSAESNLALVYERIVYKYLPYLALGLGSYYCLITIAHAYLAAPGAAPFMVGIAGFSAFALLGICIWLKTFAPPVSRAHLIETVMAEIVLLNCLAHLYFLPDLKQTTNVALAIIGGGLLFLSARWLAFFLATCVAGWALVIWTTFRAEDWIHYAFMLLTATMISLLTHTVRMTGIRQLEGTRLVIQEMELRKRAEEERSRLEAELQHAEKLRSLGVLAGGIAHDFNNLLVSVLGNAELAAKELAPNSKAQAFLAEISTAARCAADLTQQMLAYSGKGKFVVEPVDLPEIVEEMSRLLRASIPRNITLARDFPEELPGIEADATQIRQILMNLVINAAEAIGEEEGVITLSAGVEQVEGSQPAADYWHGGPATAPYVYLRVADSGRGMDEQTKARIFEPFFSTKFAGRGLGLAAVLGIVRGHRGGIRVETRLKSGTKFTVLFPRSAKTPAQRSVAAAAAEHPIRGEGTVLVVDDERAIRSLIRRVLERRGFSIVTANDGAEALQIFRKQSDSIVLVVLDLTMPRMGGRETLERLRAIRPDVSTILTSGYNQDVIESMIVEPTAFLHKPFTPRELLAAVSSALPGHGRLAAGSS
jgi:signal transduction histidine kinase/ActR/RegA family two-component response regulator